jgi:hypothetical protein
MRRHATLRYGACPVCGLLPESSASPTLLLSPSSSAPSSLLLSPPPPLLEPLRSFADAALSAAGERVGEAVGYLHSIA